jgi:hypothetical protein
VTRRGPGANPGTRQIPDQEDQVNGTADVRQGGSFGRVPRWLIQPVAGEYRFGDGEVRCYALLAAHAGKDGFCWQTLETLARELGKSPEIIRQRLKHLHEGGALAVIKGRNVSGNRRHAYWLPPDRTPVEPADLDTLRVKLPTLITRVLGTSVDIVSTPREFELATPRKDRNPPQENTGTHPKKPWGKEEERSRSSEGANSRRCTSCGDPNVERPPDGDPHYATGPDDLCDFHRAALMIAVAQ